MALLRREFLLSTSAAAGAVLFAGCVPPSREVEGESRVLLAEDLLSAYDNWYATTCRGCGAGCGAVIRVVDGRAKKVEGNPDHPVNAGKLCARGQAMVQEQYHPDRIQTPLQRDPSQGGSSPLQPTTWQTALQGLTNQLQTLQTQGRQQDVTLITPPLGAHQAFLVSRFAQAYGLKWLPFEPISEAPLQAAAKQVFGTDQLPWFDVQHARTILSFGADFLGTWLSPVRFGREYGMFRQGSYDIRNFQPNPPSGQRGRLIHVDTHNVHNRRQRGRVDLGPTWRRGGPGTVDRPGAGGIRTRRVQPRTNATYDRSKRNNHEAHRQ